MHDGKVTVAKDKLLNAVRHNLEQHLGEVRAAKAAYQAALVERLEAMLAEAKRGNDPGLIDLVAPPSHERAYGHVIAMLEYSTDEQIILTARQFQQYVLDDWEWSELFHAVTDSYSRKK